MVTNQTAREEYNARLGNRYATGHEINEVDEDEEANTCCHRAMFCPSQIREIIVTKPIARWCRRITWANLFWLANSIGMVLAGWTTLYFLLGDTMLPPAGGFGLYTLFVFSYFLGWILTCVPYVNVPPVFGMLLAGMIIRNTGFYDIHDDLGIGTTSKIRTFCLTFIMIRAGLRVTTSVLKRYPIFIVLLALVPCTIEMIVLSVCCRCILSYPWDWSFMTGTIVACMSPVVTVNCMLALAEKGYGEEKGLAALLCTAASLDDVHIVSLFPVFYSVVFRNDDHRTEWWAYIPGGVRDVVLGVLVGFVIGLFLMFFPHRNHKHVIWYRIIGLILGSLMCTAAASTLAISGGGYLATLILSFVAIRGWKMLTIAYDTTTLQNAAYYLWHLMQPMLVGVIGADIDFANWSASRFGLHVTSIILGLTARSISTYLTTCRSSFTWKERLFIVISWMPKGTLQAALAPMALERAREEGEADKIQLALDIVGMSVVAIVFMAPLGAIAMTTSGPLLLHKITLEQRQRERQLSYLRAISMQPIRTPKNKSPTLETAAT